ncbi:hypothetical protein [uncultured Acetobacterium sp.]|uniref:hypothetical protein n=1 Tax=uncultured Acetobacterium sp. TaxID=217139 RepID=UPI0025DA07BC|nr:hypothetical protein [uncultured Acetobacterium sp.]
MIEPQWKEDKIRRAVREFVDHFGENGRVMCWIMTENFNQDQEDIARDELYRYSLTYYNQRFGRN